MTPKKFITVLLSACTLCVSAQSTFEVNGILYAEDLSDPSRMAAIVLPKTSPLTGPRSTYAGKVVIPAKVEHDLDVYNVVGIARLALSSDNIEELIIEEGPAIIDEFAFGGTPRLRILRFPGSLKALKGVCSPVLESLTVSEGVTKISDLTVGPRVAVDLVLPASLTKIEMANLDAASALTLGPNMQNLSFSFSTYSPDALSISGKDLTIDRSFDFCPNLSDVQLSGCRQIRLSFEKCKVLKTMTCAAVNIDRSFKEMPALTDLKLSPECVSIVSSFRDVQSLAHLNLSSVVDIRESFNELAALTQLTIPATCNDIISSFNGCVALNNLTINEGVKRLDSSFRACRSLKSLVIPGTCNTVDASFTDCEALETLVLNEGIKLVRHSFGSSARNQNIRRIYIPASLTNLDEFGKCLSTTELKEVYFGASDPTSQVPFFIDYHSSTVTGDDSLLLTIYVPQGSTAAYESAWRLSKRKNMVVKEYTKADLKKFLKSVGN